MKGGGIGTRTHSRKGFGRLALALFGVWVSLLVPKQSEAGSVADPNSLRTNAGKHQARGRMAQQPQVHKRVEKGLSSLDGIKQTSIHTHTHTDTYTDTDTHAPLLVAAVRDTKEGASHSFESTQPSSMLQRVKVIGYFGLWYILNIWYNISNKKALNALPLPITVATLQLAIGSTYVACLWATRLRKFPVLGPAVKNSVAGVGCFHAVGQLATVMSLGAGAVSFTHIVKALEPFFSALVSALLFGNYLPLPVNLSLIPVVLGVAMACFNDVSFSMLGFLTAMLSNLAFALRATYSKFAMAKARDTSPLSAENLYGVVTIAAAAMCIPLALMLEASSYSSAWTKALSKGETVSSLSSKLVLSGLTHYTNNEVMYLALSQVHPVTLAVGNTLKRVFIIIASVIVFGTTITPLTAVGSCVGIGGVLVYSLLRERYEVKK